MSTTVPPIAVYVLIKELHRLAPKHPDRWVDPETLTRPAMAGSRRWAVIRRATKLALIERYEIQERRSYMYRVTKAGHTFLKEGPPPCTR